MLHHLRRARLQPPSWRREIPAERAESRETINRQFEWNSKRCCRRWSGRGALKQMWKREWYGVAADRRRAAGSVRRHCWGCVCANKAGDDSWWGSSAAPAARPAAAVASHLWRFLHPLHRSSAVHKGKQASNTQAKKIGTRILA
jgi:hypothetical protein